MLYTLVYKMLEKSKLGLRRMPFLKLVQKAMANAMR